MDLILFGIQGSGKGTQAKKLAQEFDYYIFEAGHELRGIASTNSDLGRTVKSYIDAGNLVPHDIIMKVVDQAIRTQPTDQKILFDGIPRDLNQMKDFDAIMQDASRTFRVIHLLLDPEEGMRRILGRAKVEGRADDANEEVIKRRMNTFVEKTVPVLEQYKKKGIVTEVDGKKSVDEVYGEMKRAIV